MYSRKRLYRGTRTLAIPSPPAGSSADILTYARSLSTTFASTSVKPTTGTALTINSQSVGNFDYTVFNGNTTVSSFVESDWFTSTKDSASAWVVVNGNLTINAGQTIQPAQRKLFTVLYVTGNLVCNGTISMSARGANHSGTGDSGGTTAAVDIRIGTGTFGAVTNPQIPATGGAGATGTTTDNAAVNGTAGSSGGTGGGGAGGKFGGTGRSGNGSAGTCFGGGSGGAGNTSNTNSGSAVANGGRGGDVGAVAGAGGGTGNPGGTGSSNGGPTGSSGTGGTLIVIVGGTLSGTGTIAANGVNANYVSGYITGGASGGGSVTVLYGTDSSSITPTATAGTGTFSGNGGAGTARKLAIGSN